MKYAQIQLRDCFNWRPGAAQLELKAQYAYSSPEYEITREPQDQAYSVRHVASGDAAEVPCANVRGAVRLAAPKQELAQKAGKR